MRTELSLLQPFGTAILLAGFLGTGAAMAQEGALDRQDRIEYASQTDLDPDTETVSCEQVSWHRDLLGRHPFVDDACHDAVVVNGERWARFEVEYLGREADGTVQADFQNPEGRSSGRATLQFPEDHRVILDGERYTWAAVREGQMLNLYVPEGQYGFATEPGVSSRQLARTTDADTDARQREQDQDRRLARAEPRPRDERQRELPATAGPLPLLGLAGLMSLLGGLGLTVRRQLLKTGA